MASIDDYRIFTNSYPEAEREFRTIEIYHPDFSSLIRLVADYQDQTFTLEAAAPRDPSSDQLFSRAGLKIAEPSESGSVEQTLTVSMGGVGNVINDQLSQVTPDGSLTPIELIYRKYYSGNLDEPVLVLTLSVADINFKSYEAVTITAEDVNFASKRAGELYTLERFEGLRLL